MPSLTCCSQHSFVALQNLPNRDSSQNYTRARNSRLFRVQKANAGGLCFYCIELGPNRVMSGAVLDGSRHFIPAGIVGVHTLSLLLSSQAAHDRATVDSHTHNKTRHVQRTRGYSNPKQGGINSVPL